VGARTSSRVVVRDRAGKVVWAGDLVPGRQHTLRATPPVTVRATDAGAVDVTVAGRDTGPLGQPGVAASRTYQRSTS
ncbi:MAG: DUF4115 domain-containing protein, partial [Nocardioidaceae bacterium]